MMIEEFGARVVSVWQGLRPSTRNLVEHALTTSPPVQATTRAAGAPYDARSEWELSRLLAALDERATEKGAASLSAEQARELLRMAETCALVLHNEGRSAEVFAQLLMRALGSRDYTRVDTLADTLSARLAPSEICELARHADLAVRAIAQEALLHAPIAVLVNLLADPVDVEVAREALARQAVEFGSEEARWIIRELESAGVSEDDI